MSNIPENENKEALGQNEENIAEEELSTIFSDPAVHKKTAENVKKKPVWVVILVAVLSVAILIGGTVGIAKLIPEKDTEDPSLPTPEEDVTVLDMDSEDFKAVTITNSNGTFKLYAETIVTEALESNTSSETKETRLWYLEGYDKELINELAVGSKVTTLGGITATMEITKMSLADCGLENPTHRVDFVTNDDKSFSVLVGKNNNDSMSGGVYLKLSDSDKIYLVSDTYKTNMEFTAFDFANTDSLPHFQVGDDLASYKNADGVITTFDTLTVSGANFGESIVIAPANSDNEELQSLIGYNIISPKKRIAENVETLFEAFQKGVLVDGVYSFDVSNASLKAVGLDNPDFVATMKIGKQTLTYKFSLQEDGNYAAIADGEKLIKKVLASNVPFAAYTTTSFYSSWVCLNGIDNLKGLTVVTPEKTYAFGIAANPDTEAEDKYVITYEGVSIDCQSFQDFYQVLISISCTDFTVDKLSGKAEYSFIFNFKDEIGGQNRIDFVKSEGSRYQYSSDSVALGKVNSSALNKIIKELNKLVG